MPESPLLIAGRLKSWPISSVESMIRKSGSRFSEKIMLKQRDEIMMRFHLIAS